MASDMKKNNEALMYLKNALDLCKTAEVPMETIVNLQEKIGIIHLKEKNYNAALEQFKIINNFLKAQDPEKYNKTIQLIRLKIAKVLVELEDFKEAGLLFNQILKEGQ
jgi:tetratricopeptide (TPR) repeat protein